MESLLRVLVESDASDLHLRSGEPPIYRRQGELARHDAPPISGERLADMIAAIMPAADLADFRERGDMDWAYEIEGVARFRCNAGNDRHGPFVVVRVIPAAVPTADALGLSREIQNLCYLNKGLVLVTGSHRLRQVHDARRDGGPGQPHPLGSHPYDRGSDRVRASEQAVCGHSAAGGAAHPRIQAGAAGRAARGSRCGAGRRNARSRDRGHRHRDGGDGPPRLRHAAYHDGGVHDRPHHRPVPGRPAVAGARHAVGVAARRHRADPLPEDRRRPGGGAGGAARRFRRSRT